jgi:hypothetical protein
LVAQRKAKPTQETHLFRSYNHQQRLPDDVREFNPQLLDGVRTKIWEACLATSAAPYYFQKMNIGQEKFLDGGAGNNNPSNIAWNEAKWMSNLQKPKAGDVAALVSIGTGDKEESSLFGNQKSLFYIYKVVKHGTREISNVERTHNETGNLAEAAGSDYFRFSVKPVAGDLGHPGLAKVKLSEVKKQRKTGWRKWTRETTKKVSASFIRRDSQRSLKEHRPQPPSWYTSLMNDMIPGPESPRATSGFNPEKYDYPTYDLIFERTREYCLSTDGYNVWADIDRCATVLLEYARARERDNPDRWKCFLSHPCPKHPEHLSSESRPAPPKKAQSWARKL